ncbi:MAG TPA: carboxypeptidase regulatory-like domain-containing protein, partial [Thermoanaerobaculia bacterium]|nr:carboxypeptidase regulatory-like domain-containing protein [Thermoanaerobaculia bacterium]
MKKLAIVALTFLGLAGGASAHPGLFTRAPRTNEAATLRRVELTEAAAIPQCRGVITEEIFDLANNATVDPAVTFEHEPKSARIACATRIWQARHTAPPVEVHVLTEEDREREEHAARARAAAAAEAKAGRPLSWRERRAAARQARVEKSAAAKSTPNAGLSTAGRRALDLYQPPVEHDSISEAKIAPYAGPPVDHTPVVPVRTRPLRDLPLIPPAHPGKGDHHDFEGHPEPVRPPPPVDSAEPDFTPVQTSLGAVVSAPTSTGLGFDGVGVGLGGFSPVNNPPDVNGRVGATQYVQWNNTSFAIFNKTTGALIYGPAAGNTLFQSLGGACASHNDGDPVVVYDIMAGRWILSQFVVEATPNFSHQCVAVSVTGDATGSYYLYDFVTDSTNFVDYPHIGVWSDGYYMSTHVFAPAGTPQVAARVYVFERDKMLVGLPARQVSADLSKKSNRFQYGFLPADLDSSTPPPAGEASFIIGPDPAFTNRTDVARVAVTWGTTPTIALTEGTVSVGIGNAPCVSNTSAQNNRDCVPQPSPAVAADYLDNISTHYMYRLAYRNFGGSPVQESLVVAALTAGSASTPSHGAVRWFEFRNAGSSSAMPTSFQAATFDPDTAYRWLPSAAMDKDHNIALGYSKSSLSVKPGIYMTGRLGTDTVNTMGAETTVMAGLGVQTTGAGNRWGDYSAMTLDPIDQCTFYFTSEYLKTDGAFNWSTRIASYKFPSCTAAASWGTVNGNVTSCLTGVPLSGVTVSLSNGFAGSTDASGNYSIPVPAGSYTITAADTARNCATSSPASAGVSVVSGGTSTQNFCMNGGSNLQFNSFALSDSLAGNNNGIVNKNECVSVNVTLKNNGCANETGVSATMTTSTPGVTVSQPNSTYPDMVIDASGTNATPFKIQTSNSFVCGTMISLSLNLTYAGGSKSVSLSVPTCAGGASQSIPLSSLTAADSTQADRLGRDGFASTCSGKASPDGGFAGTKYYKTFAFANNGGSATCFTVLINAAAGGAGDIESAAYLNAYDPTNLNLNYLGDTGIVGLGTTVTSASYSFTVPAASTFVVVVNTTGTTTSSQFSGTVSGFFDFTSGPGACPACVPPATPSITPEGPTIFCQGGNVTLTSSAASGNQWLRDGVTIAGATGQQYVATVGGSYTVTTTVSGCTSAQSAAQVVTVNATPATPTITPGGPTTFCTGGSVTLTSSSASGNQWSLNGTPIGGATGQQYIASAAGNYTVIVTTSGCSSAASAATSVTVNPIPATPTISAGGPTTFCTPGSVTLTSSSATGNQWSLNGTPIGGATGQQYVATATGNYTVVVTTSGCSSAASAATSVTANPTPATPTITPGGPTTFCTGGSVTLTSSSASGNQWSLNGTPIGGATGQQYIANASGNYTVIVTTSGCPSAASAATSVTVNPIPATPTISAGGPTTFCTPGSVTLTSSSATGNQWSLNGTPIGGATGQQYVATATGNYTVVVTTSGCSSAASAATSVTANPTPATPTITPSGPTTFCTGGSVTLTSSSASGNQWSLNGTPIGGATGQQYIANASGNYTVIVTTSGCPSSASAATSVTVNPIPATPTISAGGPTTFCAGGNVTLTSSSASGNQWYNGVTLLAGQTAQTYIATASGNYNVVVTTSGCASAPSASTAVSVTPLPTTPTITPDGPTTFCAGGNVTLTSSSASGNQWLLNGTPIDGATSDTYIATASGAYTVTVTASGCTSLASDATNVTVNPIPATPTITPDGPTTFCAGSNVTLTSSSASGNQWLLNGTPIEGATNNTYIATASGAYTVTVTTTGCTSAASSATNVTVNPIPATPTITPDGPTTFCAGSNVTLTSSSASGNQWSLNGTPIEGATNNTYIVTASGAYTVTVTTSGCTSAASSTTNVTVNPIPATPTITPDGPTTFCAGSNVTLTSSSASGNQWLLNSTPIEGATNNTYIATASGAYTVTVTTSGCTSAASAATNVTVNPIPATPTITPDGPTTFCAGGNVTLTSSSASGNQWSLNGTPIEGATNNTYIATASGAYTVTVTTTGCTSAASSATNVTVNPIPATPTITPDGPTTFCAGSNVTLTSSSASGNQWLLNGTPIEGATNNTYIATVSGAYTVTVTTSGCTSAASSATNVTVNPMPATPTITPDGPTTFCAGSNVTLTSSSASGNQWLLNGTPIEGATNNTYIATASGAYTVTVTTTGCTSAASSATNVTVNPIPATPTITPDGPTTFCAGSNVTLTSSSASGNQWLLNGTPIEGATNNTYIATVS